MKKKKDMHVGAKVVVNKFGPWQVGEVSRLTPRQTVVLCQDGQERRFHRGTGTSKDNCIVGVPVDCTNISTNVTKKYIEKARRSFIVWSSSRQVKA